MSKLVVREEFCKACGICIEHCPPKVLSLSNRVNSKGYNSVELVDEDGCISCGFCYLVCPDLVIDVYKSEKEKGDKI